METQTEMQIEIGTIEQEKTSLKPAKLKIINATIEDVPKAKSKKAVFEVKHPDKEETIKISSAAYLSGREIITSGTWFNLDKEGKIQKGSALAILLNKLQAKTISETIGKEIESELDGKYLCFKAY